MSIPCPRGPISLSIEESSSWCSACWVLCLMPWRAGPWCLLNFLLLLLLFLLLLLHLPRGWALLGAARTGRRRHPSFCSQSEDVWDCSPKVLCSPVPIVGWHRFWGAEGEGLAPSSWSSQQSLRGSCRNPRGWGEEARVCFCALQESLQMSQQILCFLAEFGCWMDLY